MKLLFLIFTVLFGLGVCSLMFTMGMAPMVDGIEKGDALVVNAEFIFPFVLIGFACCLGVMIVVAKNK